MPTEIRELANHAEFADAVHLQRMVWGWDDLDLLPVRFFVVAKSIGGQLLGAFDRDFMFGFLLAIPGVQPDGTVYLHSHMLGVLPEYRDTGAGYALKMTQRDDALQRGIRMIEWTFDPLELKNAYFNLEKLGAIVRRYVPNQYGTTTSRLHGGLPTDRCVAEWYLDGAATKFGEKPPIEARVAIPTDIHKIKRADPEAAREIQKHAGERFHDLIASGLAVVGFERSHDYGSYLFGKLELER
jgi:predicted GNAT superfamily acetyltransferase